MTADESANPIIPETMFPQTRLRFPALKHLIDEADMMVPGMSAVAERWNRDYVVPQLATQQAHPTLLFRLALFSVAVVNRGIQLTEAIAREVEADSLFGSAAVARSQLDLIGLSAYARQQVVIMPEPTELAVFTNPDRSRRARD